MAKTTTQPENSLFAKQLREMKERWNKGKQESKKPGFGEGTTLTKGQYATRLTTAKLINTEKGPSVVFEFTCVRGDQTGEKGVRFAGMDTDDRIIYLQRDLRKLGQEVDELDIEQLPAMLKALVDEKPGVRITVKESGEYLNVYIDKLMELEDDEQIPDAEAASSGNDDATEATDGEEGLGEPAAETEAEEAAEGPGFEIADDVAYVIKGKKQTGVVKKINDDDMVEIKNDVTKKVDKVNVASVTVLAATE